MNFPMLYDDHWKTWRHVAAANADSNPGASIRMPSHYEASKSIVVHPATRIMLSFWGSGDDNGTADAFIIGWMNPNHAYPKLNSPPIPGNVSSGPGFTLVKYTLILGASTTMEEVIPDGNWSGYTLRPVDTATIGGGSSLLLEQGATETRKPLIRPYLETTSGNELNMIIFPTVGFFALTLLIRNFTLNAATMGCIWRKLPIEAE